MFTVMLRAAAGHGEAAGRIAFQTSLSQNLSDESVRGFRMLRRHDRLKNAVWRNLPIMCGTGIGLALLAWLMGDGTSNVPIGLSLGWLIGFVVCVGGSYLFGKATDRRDHYEQPR